MRKGILAGINENMLVDEFANYIDECENLCLASNIKIVGKCFQNSKKIDPKTAFRSGKLQELSLMVQELQADCVVFYNNLSIYMLGNISEECHCEILDRTTLILDIFSSRAATREAKLQTAIARLQYNLPKALIEENNLGKERGGGVRNRGSGEARIELAKRNITHEITQLRKQLKRLETHTDIQQQARKKSGLKSVALVGYTNAGKSSLMNALLENRQNKRVLQKDMLFATLDTSVRNMSFKDGQEYLLFDTVGFVSDLPHDLIEAFNSTLQAAKDADLLLHVMDASNHNIAMQKEVTLKTLQQIGASNIPIINVYNKIDKVKDFSKADGYQISCISGQGIAELLVELEKQLYPNEKEMTCLLPYDQMALIANNKKYLNIENLDNKDTGLLIRVKGTTEAISIFTKYQVSNNDDK